MKHHGCLICAGTSRATYCGPCATSRFFQESWTALGMAAQQRAEVLSRLDVQLAVKVRMPVPVPLVCACTLAQSGISFQLEHAFGCMLKHVNTAGRPGTAAAGTQQASEDPQGGISPCFCS